MIGTLHQFLCAAGALLLWGTGSGVWAQTDTADSFETSLVEHWDFGSEQRTPGKVQGEVLRDQPGPRPPEFPEHAEHNVAWKFLGSGGRFEIEDVGANSPFDFTNDDAITIEAWVNLSGLADGSHGYVIGKGRTHSGNFPRDNQNWALRLTGRGSGAALSFLFATEPTAGDQHWHRWTSEAQFAVRSGWHHVAVTYRFGEPDSIRGWIDGEPTKGKWDMGGATVLPPIVDDAPVWIGSSMAGSSGNSFRGRLDEVRVYRSLATDDLMKPRFRRVGAPRNELPLEVAPVVAPSPGSVRIELFDSMPLHDQWPEPDEMPSGPTDAWLQSHGVVVQLPQRYDAWGIRDEWHPPVLLRSSAQIDLPAGTHRFLIRGRGLSRLWVNQQVVARIGPHRGSSDGHEPVDPLPIAPAPDHRIAAYGDQEAFGEITLDQPTQCVIVYESMVGSKRLRAEPGELMVAVQRSGLDRYELIQAWDNPSPSISLREPEVLEALEQSRLRVQAHDDQQRRARSASQDSYWERRREAARRWAETQERSVPAHRIAASHPIDFFLEQRAQQARAQWEEGQASEAQRLAREVAPILEQRCQRCHGAKAQGGLRLDSLASALTPGDSGNPAVIAGDADHSELMLRVTATSDSEAMPPEGRLSEEEIAKLRRWIDSGATWPEQPLHAEQLEFSALTSDVEFLRRVMLDTIGLPPTAQQVRRFLNDPQPDKRAVWIDRLLADDRWADHWVSYWQDVLAENPNMLKPSLNNSGPFRWFLYEALRDNKGVDRWVTELIAMRGSVRAGGSAGFAVAADNDAPLAEKGHVLASAFLGIDMKCARCHDAPFHQSRQEDLFSLAAMLSRKEISVPATSSVAPGFFEAKGRESLIEVTLPVGQSVTPRWTLATQLNVVDSPELDQWLEDPNDSRARLALLMTMPQNERFARVIVNRVWQRLMGSGLVEPIEDWEGNEPSHPELLNWLAIEFVAHGYDLKQLCRTIMTSQAYQRQARAARSSETPERRFFTAPSRRRLSAEQLVDSLYHAAGLTMDVEELSFDPDGRRAPDAMTSLGKPTRAWEFATLSNERDRPSLSLPRAQAVVDVLEAFGWTAVRTAPIQRREVDPNVLQSGILANGTLSTWICRPSAESELSELAIQSDTPEALINELYLRFLGRFPKPEEAGPLIQLLTDQWNERVLPQNEQRESEPLEPLGRVSWSNHLDGQANAIQIERERRARLGPPIDPRFRMSWAKAYEDVVWAIVNSPEFVWVP